MSQLLSAPLCCSLLLLGALSCGRPGADERDPAEDAPPAPVSFEGFDPELVSLVEEHLDALRARPSDAEAWTRLGMLYEAHVMSELAEPCYARAVALDEDRAEWWYRLAMTRAANGALDGALAAVERTCALAPDYAPALCRRGAWLSDLGRFEEAAASYADALCLDGPRAAALLGLAQVNLAREDPDAALALLADAELAEGPAAALAHRLRGTALARLGREAEAARELEAGRSARPYIPDPWTRAVADFKLGSTALLLKATRMIEKNRFEAAAEVLEEARRRDPVDVRVLRKLAVVYTRLGQSGEAAQMLREAVAEEPEDAQLRLALAAALLQGGDPEAALTALEGVLALEPASPTARLARMEVLLALGRAAQVVEAEAEVRAVARDAEGGARIDVLVGKALIELRQMDEALERFVRAGEAAPELADAWAGQALALLALGRPVPARAAIARLAELEPAHELLPELRSGLAHAEEAGQDIRRDE